MKPLDEKALEAAHKAHFDAYGTSNARLEAAIRAYMAALEPAPGWMPMDSAPEDQPDAIIDIWVIAEDDPTLSYRMTDCMFVNGEWCINEHLAEWEPLRVFGVYAAYWQPLSAAPMSQEG